MVQDDVLLIRQVDGMSPLVSHLFKMMNYIRLVTLDSVRGLSVGQLDHLHDEKSNSIGALLSHIAAVEYDFQALSFENRTLTEAEERELLPALDLGELGREKIRGNPLEFYIERLHAVRRKTVEGLRMRDDNWLLHETQMWGRPTNHYFMWFHCFEDEANHRGQINWLRKRLPAI